MGKDNAYFHTVYFPGMLLADGREWTTLHHLSVTGQSRKPSVVHTFTVSMAEHLNYESGKFSKSRNVGVFGPSAKDTGVPSSVWRYCLLSNRPETGDSVFSWADLVSLSICVAVGCFILMYA